MSQTPFRGVLSLSAKEAAGMGHRSLFARALCGPFLANSFQRPHLPDDHVQPSGFNIGQRPMARAELPSEFFKNSRVSL